MTPEERDLVNGLFARLKSADTPSKDPDAEDLIRRNVTEFPAAPYLMAQTILVQEHALNGAQARIGALEKELADARASRSSQSTSFLGGLRQAFGGSPDRGPDPPAASHGSWATRVGAAAPQSYQPPPSQPGSYQQPPYQQPPYQQPPAYAASNTGGGSGGFLHSALSTAAGVAGGALVFQGIERLLGHTMSPFGSPFGYGAGFGGSSLGSPWGATPMENVTVNNYYDTPPDGAGSDQRLADGNLPSDDPAIQDADYVPDADPTDNGGGSDFDGGDFGGGDWT